MQTDTQVADSFAWANANTNTHTHTCRLPFTAAHTEKPVHLWSTHRPYGCTVKCCVCVIEIQREALGRISLINLFYFLQNSRWFCATLELLLFPLLSSLKVLFCCLQLPHSIFLTHPRLIVAGGWEWVPRILRCDWWFLALCSASCVALHVFVCPINKPSHWWTQVLFTQRPPSWLYWCLAL